MIVYHALGSTLCMFVPVIRELTVEFYRQLVRDSPSMSMCRAYSIHRHLLLQDASLGPILTNMSADLMDVFGQDSRRREQSRELEIYVQNVNAVMPGLVTAAELIASTVRFLYFNKSNLAMKSTLYMLPHEELEVC